MLGSISRRLPRSRGQQLFWRDGSHPLTWNLLVTHTEGKRARERETRESRSVLSGCMWATPRRITPLRSTQHSGPFGRQVQGKAGGAWRGVVWRGVTWLGGWMGMGWGSDTSTGRQPRENVHGAFAFLPFFCSVWVGAQPQPTMPPPEPMTARPIPSWTYVLCKLVRGAPAAGLTLMHVLSA